MTNCKNCGLAFDNVNAAGHCDGCATELSQQQQTPQRDQQLDAIQAQLAQNQQQFAMLNNSLRQQTAPPPQAQAAPDRTAINREIWADPAKVLEFGQAQTQQMINQAVSGAMAQDHEAMVELAKDKAKGTDPDEMALFDKYYQGILQRVATVAPQFHRNPTVWRNAFHAELGAHHREIRQVQRDEAETGRPRSAAIRTHDGPSAPSPRSGPSPQKTQLPDDAKFIARKLRITDDQMRQGIADYANQGDTKDPSKASSWDKVISFDQNTGQLGKRRAQKQAARTA